MKVNKFYPNFLLKNGCAHWEGDSRTFDGIDVVAGKGTTAEIQAYSYIDKSPASFAYYRLKQVDFDGAFEFSPVVVLRMESFKEKKMDVYPTLAQQKVTIRFSSLETQKASLIISDSFGRLLYEEEVYSSDQLEFRVLDLTNYENGLYHVVLFDGVDNRTGHFMVTNLR